MALAGHHAQAATIFTGTGPATLSGTIGNTTASGSSGTVGSANGGFAANSGSGAFVVQIVTADIRLWPLGRENPA